MLASHHYGTSYKKVQDRDQESAIFAKDFG